MPEDIRLSVGGDTRPLSREIDKVRKKGLNLNMGGLGNFKNPLGKITGQLGEFEKSLEASNARVLAFGASAGALVAVQQGLKAIVSEAINVEKSLADINVILNVSSTSLQKFSQDLFNVAKNTGQSFEEVATAATELSRQGLSVEETLKRTQDALILTRLSGLKAAESVQAVTAALNSFSRAALDSSEFVSKLAAVDAAFAVDSGDLAKAIQRVGSSAQDAGVSLDQLIAIVTSAQQITARGGAVIGNSFKTIFTRIQRPRVLKELENLGIGVSDLSGNTRPAIQILTELAKTFDTLGSAQRAQIAELVGGVFQVNVLKASLRDLGKEFSLYNNALGISATATDEAARRNEELNKTIAATLNQTVQNFKQFGSQAGQLTFGPAISNILGGINSALEGFDLKQAESTGEKVASGVLSGIGRFLAGPGLLVGAVTLVKTFSRLGQQVTDAFKTISGLGGASAEQLKIQQKVNQVLGANPQILDAIESGALDIAEAHRLILTGINKETAAYQKQAGIIKQLSGLLRQSNVGVSETLGGGTSLATGKLKSRGHIPNFANREKVMKAMELNSASYTTPSTRAIKDNISGVGPIIRNSKEDKVNVPGLKQPFINPPRSSSEGKLHRANSIKQTGIDPYLLSRGFIPNFAEIQDIEQIKEIIKNVPTKVLTGEGLSEQFDFPRGKSKKRLDTAIFGLSKGASGALREGYGKYYESMVERLADDVFSPNYNPSKFNFVADPVQFAQVRGSLFQDLIGGLAGTSGGGKGQAVDLNTGVRRIFERHNKFGIEKKFTPGLFDALDQPTELKESLSAAGVGKTGTEAENYIRAGIDRVAEQRGRAKPSKKEADQIEKQVNQFIDTNMARGFIPNFIKYQIGQKLPKGRGAGGRHLAVRDQNMGIHYDPTAMFHADLVKKNNLMGKTMDGGWLFPDGRYEKIPGHDGSGLQSGGFIPNFATGIFDSDKIKGDRKLKNEILNQILDSGKPIHTFHGAAGTGKTTMASKRFGRNFVLSAADIQKYSDFAVISGAGRSRKTGNISAQTQKIFDKSSNISAVVPTNQEIIKRRFNRLDEAKASGSPDTRDISGLRGTLKAPLNDFGIYSNLRKQGKNVELLRNKGFVPNFRFDWNQILSDIKANDYPSQRDAAEALGIDQGSLSRAANPNTSNAMAPQKQLGAKKYKELQEEIKKLGSKGLKKIGGAGLGVQFENALAKNFGVAASNSSRAIDFNKSENRELKSNAIKGGISRAKLKMQEDTSFADAIFNSSGHGDDYIINKYIRERIKQGKAPDLNKALLGRKKTTTLRNVGGFKELINGGTDKPITAREKVSDILKFGKIPENVLSAKNANKTIRFSYEQDSIKGSLFSKIFKSSGFIPNFNEVLGYGKGSLGEAIDREMSATGNSRREIGVDSNPALRTSQNPMGLGVFDKKRETSLEHGMELARAAGINPKTKGKFSGHIPNFALFEGEAAQGKDLLRGIKVGGGKGSGEKFKQLAATLDQVSAAYKGGLPEAAELEASAAKLAGELELSAPASKKYREALKGAAASGKQSQGAINKLSKSFTQPTAAMQGLETRLLSASFAIPVITDTVKQFGGELSQTTDGLINSISGGISTFSGIASILPGPAGIAAAGLAGAGAAASGIAKALQATAEPLKRAAEQSKEDFTKLSNNLTGYAQAFGEFQSAAADTKTSAQTLLRLKDKLNGLLESVPDEFRLELAGLQNPEELQSKIAEILNKETKADIQRQIEANIAVDLDEASGIVSGLVELFGGASKEFRQIFDGAKGEIEASRLVADIRKGLEFKDLAEDLGDARKATKLQNASQNELIDILGKQFGATAGLQLQLRELASSDFNKFRRGLIESAQAARRAAEATDRLSQAQKDISNNLGIGDQQAGIGILQMNVDFEAQAMKTLAGGIEAFLDPSKLKEPVDALSAAIKQAAQLGNFGAQTTASGRIARGRAELGIGKGLVELLGVPGQLDPKKGRVDPSTAVGQIVENASSANEERIRTFINQQRQQLLQQQSRIVGAGRAPDETIGNTIKELTRVLTTREGASLISQAARTQTLEGLGLKEAPRTAVNLQTAAQEGVRGLGAAVESRGGTGVKAIGNATRDLLSQLEAAAEREGRILTQRQERGLDTTESVKALDAIEAAARELKDARQSGTLETFDITKLTNLQTSRGNQVIGAATFGAGVDETPAQKVLREAQDKLRQSQDQLREEISQLTDVIAREQEQEKRNETIDRFTREVGAEVDRIQNINTDQRQSQIRSELGQTTVGAAILGAKGATSSANVNLLRQEGAQEALQSLPQIVGRLAINETGKVFEEDIEAFKESFEDIIDGQGSTLKTLLDTEQVAERKAKIEETAFNTIANILISANKGNFQAQQLLKDAIAAKNAANAAPASPVEVENRFDRGILEAFKREQKGIRSMGLGSSVKPVLRVDKANPKKMLMANTAEDYLNFKQLDAIGNGGTIGPVKNAFLGTMIDQITEQSKVNPKTTAVGLGLGGLGIGFGAKKAFKALKNRKLPKAPKGKTESRFASGETSTGKDKLKKQLSRSVQNTDKSTKATSKFSEALEKARKAVTNLLPKKATPNSDNFFRPTLGNQTQSQALKLAQKADKVAKGTMMMTDFGPIQSQKLPSPATAQDSMRARRFGVSGPQGMFEGFDGRIHGERLVPDTPEKKPSGSSTKPGAPKSSGALTKPGAPTTTPPTTRTTPPTTRTNPPRVRGLAPLTPPKPGIGVGKGLGIIGGLLQAASARNEFTRLDDPEKFIDQRVDQFGTKSNLNAALAGFDPTTLVTIFGSTMQRQNDKLQVEQDRQNNAIRLRGLHQRGLKKSGESIMGLGAPELVADLSRRINRDGFSGSRAIQSGFRRESEEIMHGDGRFGDVPFAGFQKGLEALRSNMSLGLTSIKLATADGLTARRTSDSLDGKESVKVNKLLQIRLQDLGQAVPAEGATLEGRQLKNLKEAIDRLVLNAETEKEAIAEKEFIQLADRLKRTNAIFETNFDLSQLMVERETGQVLNPLQFFQRAGNADSFRNIAATALENEKANRLRNQFNPELIRQRQEEFTGSDLGASANRIQAVADSAGKALGGAMQNTVTRVLDNFKKLGGQPGIEKALRTPTSQLDSRTREALLKLQQALKEQSAVLREAGFGAEAKEVELSRLQTFDPTNQRINTIQQEMKKAQEDARKAKETAQHDQGVAQMFGQPFADRARGIRNITEEATALGEEIIRDYGSSAATMAANQGKSLQQIAAARAAAENEAKAATESTVHHAGVFGIDDPRTLAASTGDTRMIEMARLMQQRMALRLQQEKDIDPRMAELREQLDPETFANVQRRRRALQSGQLTPANRAIVEQKQREDLKGTKFGDGITTSMTHSIDAHRSRRLAEEKMMEAIQANTVAVIAKNEADATMQEQQQQQEQQATATNNVTTNANIQLAVSLDQALSELTPQLVAGVKNALIKDLETKMPEVATALKAAPPQIQQPNQGVG
jgi:TP901 family phage tail tape measure protein